MSQFQECCTVTIKIPSKELDEIVQVHVNKLTDMHEYQEKNGEKLQVHVVYMESDEKSKVRVVNMENEYKLHSLWRMTRKGKKMQIEIASEIL